MIATFNGEIYNWREWRLQLDQGAASSTIKSDGEVLLPLYRRFGPSFVKFLDGEFAVVVVDY